MVTNQSTISIKPGRGGQGKPEFAKELKDLARQRALDGHREEARSLYCYVVGLCERIFGEESDESQSAREMFQSLYPTKPHV